MASHTRTVFFNGGGVGAEPQAACKPPSDAPREKLQARIEGFRAWQVRRKTPRIAEIERRYGAQAGHQAVKPRPDPDGAPNQAGQGCRNATPPLPGVKFGECVSSTQKLIGGLQAIKAS
jgi:hypothetical protein